MASSADYELRPVESDPASLRSYVELFRGSFGETDLTPEFLDWQYNHNPLGPVVGFNAYRDGELAAHYVTIPNQARLGGQVTRGLLSINTATHPNHQKRGLFIKLAERTFDRGRELGHEFVVGVANQNSVHGFVKKLGFQSVGLLDRRFVSGLRTKEPPTALDYVSEWSLEALQWRMANPLRSYAALRNGNIAQIVGRTQRFPALVGQVPADRVPASAARAGFTPVKMWLGLDSRINGARTLQLPVPRRFQPVPLTLIFRDLVGDKKIDPRATAFWAIDFDAY